MRCHTATLPVFHLKVNWSDWLDITSESLTSFCYAVQVGEEAVCILGFLSYFCFGCLFGFGFVCLLSFFRRLVDQRAGSSSFISQFVWVQPNQVEDCELIKPEVKMVGHLLFSLFLRMHGMVLIIFDTSLYPAFVKYTLYFQSWLKSNLIFVKI